MNTPEKVIQFAYADLVREVFLHLRNRLIQDPDQLHDLGDALHNICGMLGEEGWICDQEYRRLYLKYYDSRWGSKGLALEAFLDERIKLHSQE
jgi:hypothetical protein